MIVSCNGANFVAQQLGYHMNEWDEGDRASNAFYSPPVTFASRFETLLLSVKEMGFDHIDVWTGELNWSWATDAHLEAAASLLQKHDVYVSSYAGAFGANEAELKSACRVIKALGGNILGGSSSMLTSDPAKLAGVLDQEEVLFAFENHPAEKSPADVLRVVADLPEDVVGAAVDTGWFGTNGYDAAKAIEELAARLFLVHLKDVKAPGAHETCRFGQGCVPLEKCISVLKDLGYEGTLSIEHEPHDSDPREDIIASRELLEGWLA